MSDRTDLVRQWQLALQGHGYEVGSAGADGDFGPSTLRASLKLLNGEPGGNGRHTLLNSAAFFLSVRNSFGALSQGQVDGINALLVAMERWPVSWASYGLATAFHETAGTMQPIAEYGKGKGRKYGVPGKHFGQVAYGRGVVQLTWDYNYEKADTKLMLMGALLKDYDLAMRPDIAAKIMVRGMEEGWFTGKKLGDYLPGDYVEARRIINGTDKATKIAGEARAFETALAAGGW